MTEKKNGMQVIPLEEHDGEFKKVSDNLLALREHVKNVEESSGVKIDEMKDELAKSVEALAGIQKEYEKTQQELAEVKRSQVMTVGSDGLAKELKQLEDGFRAPSDTDGDYEKHAPGTKPTIKHLIEGVYLPGEEKFWSPNNDQVAELQALNDAVLITDGIMRHMNGASYQAQGGMKSLRSYKRLMSKVDQVTKANTDFMDTDFISNWVPTHFSERIFNLVKIGLPELNIFEEVPMPGKTFDLNVDLTDVTGDFVTETTTISGMDPFADSNAQAINDAKATLTAKKFRARVPFSGEAEEDAIGFQMSMIRNAIIRALREAKADALVNGDAGGTMDTGGEHFGVGGNRTNPPSAPDPRAAFDGLRAMALDNTASPAIAVDISGEATAAALQSMRATMGEFGVDPAELVHLVSYTAYLNMLGDSNLLTMDNVGDRATLIRGAMGAVNGSSIAISRRFPHNMNASGIIDGVTETKTGLLTVNRRGAVVGNRRRDTIGQQRWEATDSMELVVFSRIAFAMLFGNAYPWLSYGYNVNT